MKLGRLKHSLDKKCPDCRAVLQLRVRTIYGVEEGVEISSPEEYIVCPKCGYEEEVEKKRKRRKDNILEV
jgi:DNA-directed RNA polymerase subunit M/transcription elongation factor TFIIS